MFFRAVVKYFLLFEKEYRSAEIQLSSYYMYVLKMWLFSLHFQLHLSLMSRDGKATVLLGDAQWKQALCCSHFYWQTARPDRALAFLFE